MFLKVLVENGWYGFFSLVIFMISLVWSINYWYSLRQKVEIVKDVADELTTEKIKSEPDFFHNTSPDQYRNQLKENLLKKVEKENYVFFGKKA